MKNKVIITDEQTKVKIPTGLRLLVRRSCTAVLVSENFEGSAEVSVTFVDDERIQELNKQYRNIDSSTDVLSFPLLDYEGESEEPFFDELCHNLGDIVISLERAMAQANEFGHSFEREVAFLTAHSMLHLLGYDHETSEEDELDMRRRQTAVMEMLGLAVK